MATALALIVLGVFQVASTLATAKDPETKTLEIQKSEWPEKFDAFVKKNALAASEWIPMVYDKHGQRMGLQDATDPFPTKIVFVKTGPVQASPVQASPTATAKYRYSCIAEVYHPCIGGFRAPKACASSFQYQGKTYSGNTLCTLAGSKIGMPWCSHVPSFESASNASGDWSYCFPCTESTGPGLLPAATKFISEKIWCQEWMGKMVVTVGDHCSRDYLYTNINPRRHTYDHGQGSDLFTEKERLFSGGKWPGAVAIAGAVKDGYLNFTTYAKDVFDWWTKDPKDTRYHVQLKHLMDFSSGFNRGGGLVNKIPTGPLFILCMAPLPPLPINATKIEHCAREIYDFYGPEWKIYRSFLGIPPHEDVTNSSLHCTDGQYNSMHQVIALAMVTTATKLTEQEYLQKYLFTPFGMTNTEPMKDLPVRLSDNLLSTRDDIESFLKKYVENYDTEEILPKNIIEEMEKPRAKCSNGDINAMGHHRDGDIGFWGGWISEFVNRKTKRWMEIAPDSVVYLNTFGGGANNFGKELLSGFEKLPSSPGQCDQSTTTSTTTDWVNPCTTSVPNPLAPAVKDLINQGVKEKVTVLQRIEGTPEILGLGTVCLVALVLVVAFVSRRRRASPREDWSGLDEESEPIVSRVGQ